MRFGIAFSWRMYSTSSGCSPHSSTCATQGPASGRHIAPTDTKQAKQRAEELKSVDQ